jgi:hypothetical protein
VRDRTGPGAALASPRVGVNRRGRSRLSSWVATWRHHASSTRSVVAHDVRRLRRVHARRAAAPGGLGRGAGPRGGGCSYHCAEGSTCNIECDGGDCRLSCGVGATCNFECDGGRCGTGCGSEATCNLECDGGTCAHACAPDATCNAECDGGDCS